MTPIVPTAFHTYAFTRTWRSFRTAPLTWTKSVIVAQGSFRTCSSGLMTKDLAEANPNKLGLIHDGPYFAGNGPPDPLVLISPVNTPISGSYFTPDYWDMSHGAWWINGAWYAVLLRQDPVYKPGLAVIKGVVAGDGSIVWTEMDQSNTPQKHVHQRSAALRWDGVSLAIDVFTSVVTGGGVISGVSLPFGTVIGTGCSGFSVGDQIGLNSGEGAIVQVNSVDSFGGIEGVDLIVPGNFYETGSVTSTTMTILSGSGVFVSESGAPPGLFTLDIVASPILESQCLQTFDMSTDTWSDPYGVLDFGRLLRPSAFNSSYGNNIFRYPNGDIGVFYGDNNFDKIYYRLFSGGSWGSEITVASKSDYTGANVIYTGAMIPHTSQEYLHVFTVHLGIGQTGVYHVVQHDGTVTQNCFIFPNETIDGFGNPVILDNLLLIPYDGTRADPATNSVWEADITGGATTFVEGFIASPAEEEGASPSCAYLSFSAFVSAKKFLPQHIKRHNLLGH